MAFLALVSPAWAVELADASSIEAGDGGGDLRAPHAVLEQLRVGTTTIEVAAPPLQASLDLGIPALPDTSRPRALPVLSARRPVSPYLTSAAETLAVQGLVMGWNRYVGSAPWATVSADSVHSNLTSGWVLDDNAYFVNQLGHPYQGTFPFTAARSAGLGFWASSAFPFAASALWEVAGETERPSINDQVTTTVAGIVLGEVLYRTSDWIRGDGRSPWRSGVATLLTPMSTVNRSLRRFQPAPNPVALRTESWVGMQAGVDRPDGDPSAARAPLIGLSLTEGVPGDPAFHFERPFDHFDARFAFAPADDPTVELRARGLMAGEAFAEGERGGGLWGLWLGFDLTSPGPRRVSTSSLGVGATGRWAVAPELTLEGTAIGSAVLLGAAGVVERAPGSDRDYRFGPGTQGLLELRVLAGDRVSAGVSLRQYLVFGAGESTGSDLLLDGAVSARVRLVGHHGLLASASRFQRTARDAGRPLARQEGSQVTVAWVYGVDPPPPVAARVLDPDA